MSAVTPPALDEHSENEEVIRANAPDWLLQARSEDIGQLREYLRNSQLFKEELLFRLKALKPVLAFCEPLLEQALLTRFGRGLDVHKDALLVVDRWPHLPAPFVPQGAVPMTYTRHSLLEVALQNFEAGEVLAPQSYIHLSGEPKPTLTPAALVEWVRALDLGGLYQQHLCNVFHLPTQPGQQPDEDGQQIEFALAQQRKADLLVDACSACMKKDIDTDAYQQLCALIESNTRVAADGSQIQVNELRMLGVKLSGVRLFTRQAGSSDGGVGADRGLLVHVPNDPRCRFKHYPSLEAFRAELCQRLWEPSYEAFFSGLVGQVELPAFLSALRKCLARPVTDADGKPGTVLDPQADLQLKLLVTTEGLFSLLCRQQIQRLQDDARHVAVPTEDVDQAARTARYQARLGVGLTVLNLAAFANPWLGLLMMGVAVGELLAEVYEGYQDWQDGEHDEAIAHMMSVAEDIATMLALGAALHVGGKLVGNLFRRTSAFFDELVPVRSSDGRYRLWQASLEPYVHDEPRFTRHEPDRQGFYRGDVADDGHRYLAIAGRPYRAYRDDAAGGWRLRHRSRKAAYEPLLEHNGAGGWKLVHEWPGQWQDPLYLMRRLGPELGLLEDEDIERVLAIHRLDEPLLRRLHIERRGIPAALLDSIRRFRLDRELSWLAASADAPPAAARALLDVQLQILPDLPGWPRSGTILLVDGSGASIHEYGADLTSRPLPMRVSAKALEADGLQVIIDELGPSRWSALLGTSVPPGQEVAHLERALQAHVGRHRQALFERLYRLRWLVDSGVPESLRRRFPDLPDGVLREAIAQSDVSVRDRLLLSARLPLQLVEDVSGIARELRIDRALEGGFLRSASNPDTARLQLPRLADLSGWPADLRLEVRQGSVAGPLLAEIGKVELPRRRVLVRTQRGYQAFDGAGRELGSAVSGTDALSAVVLNTLSVAERMAMGFRLEEEDQLHKTLINLAMAHPQAAQEEALGLSRRKPGAQPAFWRRAERADCTRIRRGAGESSRRRLRRVTWLYPDFCEAEAQAFLLLLGDDSARVHNRIRTLELELRQLCSTLSDWHAGSSDQPERYIWLGGMQENRKQAAQILERCWRRQTPKTYDDNGVVIGHGLSLEGLRVASLPELPEGISFEHVTALSLKSMDLQAIPASFLGRFPKLRKLELGNNRLESLPAEIAEMSELRELHLQDNRIVLDQASADRIANLRHLEVLNLNGNHDVGLLDVGRLPHLRRLLLRSTGIDHLPTGLLTRTSLSVADLRGNLIQALPSELYEAPWPITRRIILRYNPLGQANQSPLAAYRLRTGITFGIPESELALDEYSSRLRWLADIEGERRTRLQALWQDLWHEPGSQELFDLLGRLSGSADYLKTRADLVRRVWEVLEAAAEDGALRRELFELTANPMTCVDSAAQNFSHLEVRVLQAKARAQATQEEEPSQLLKLARGLFRLEQIDDIAREHVRALQEQPEVPTTRSVDEVEVHLAYRVGLSRLMHLPGQPQDMLFGSLAQVSEAQLQAAQQRILAAEQTPSLTAFIAGRDFWIDYLKKQHPREFSRFNQPFHDQEELMLRQSPDMLSEKYFRQLSNLMDTHKVEEQQFLTRLTRLELDKHPAPLPGT
ncbi:NEL-type E3 ubiquitin ligase domain-containing protein [Pseudomonas fuscovaginae UPB0736]|uniref:NEL-type E3 ubiquitin ligase domain-containing protein n=1 Tax=Pseudomonas asplenii TaxID=53407 RepID=UPI001E2F3122|nr:NEL-type E3 ubiquitin ligase domain-containing protein [Pseudomonas fuscovaginae]UUQ63973.1 NEL-type E3 ubiquitin ligase domain-containing protein [Pseudomonas fuscovaginae UPB0736]